MSIFISPSFAMWPKGNTLWKRRMSAAAAAWMCIKRQVVCVLPPDGTEGKPVKKVYGTFHADLGRMRGWLKQLKVTSIAMESTGVYWRPVWNVLEGHGFELLLANPKQVKALHGRKSDKRDSERIAQFLQDRRLDPSFVPAARDPALA
jgi:transposase